MRTHYLKDEICRSLAAHPYGMSMAELIYNVYRGREPDCARNSIQVTIHRMRKTPGLRIETVNRGGWRYLLKFA